MAQSWAGGGQSNVYTLPTVRLQAVGNAFGGNCRLNKQHLSGSAIAHHLAANHSIVRLHRLQFFRPKNLAVDAKNSYQSGFSRL
ncbi:hypothetical protein LC605_29450 [Nostoc sp. CHAB 5836]|uniref:hypothetical protein n=1 Tax=Nostoc sp. CHAB 5836 TaxID=2780404 RepID=UPI001E3F58A9|nr:hypothetical protein [Nostoc sp. CHAB 5836]MCC5619135.1 hypothetical protein [Nostoc sp. CHAB 5836]